MKEIVIKIQFDDTNGYKGHDEDTAELIKIGIEQYLEIDLQGDGVIKKNWSVEIIDQNRDV
jgi:hypothetical protein